MKLEGSLTHENHLNAPASSVIQHTVHGNTNITDDAESIRSLMNLNYDMKH